ncbi:hypothetical protein B0I37DRAFT_417342 [Chaetomium sp. MPI-CAGE-AT-0009]|nr:hypothetical protein B0I37DRAFT_417342 [Chaetomium sp. MPI-CAGE-AT-0009]
MTSTAGGQELREKVVCVTEWPPRHWVGAEREMGAYEFEDTHGLVVPFVYWQESLEGGGRTALMLEQHWKLVKEYEENGFRGTGRLQEQTEKPLGLSVERD